MNEYYHQKLANDEIINSSENLEDVSRLIIENKSKIHTIAKLGLLISAATTLQIFESTLPRFAPWFKPGLANSITLYTIVSLPSIYTFYVVILRGIISGIFLGTLFTPTYFIGLGGAVLSTITMIYVYKYYKHLFGYIGISVFGAIAHNFGQFEVFCMLLDSEFTNRAFYYALLVISAIPAGILVGYVTKKISDVLSIID